MATTERHSTRPKRAIRSDPGDAPVDRRPVIFVSHKHMDVAIASRTQDELSELLGDAVRIHNTSDARGGAPPRGTRWAGSCEPLLHQTSLVILLDTADDEDWRWYFYECGVANDPMGDVPTETVVSDFGTERGSGVFAGDKHLVVTPLDADSNRRQHAPAGFRKFVRDLVTTDTHITRPDDHPDHERDEHDVFDAADKLHLDLLEVGPATRVQLAEEMQKALKSVPAMDRRQWEGPTARSWTSLPR